MSYLINENTVQVQPHWSSNWSNRKKTKMAKMRVNQNKSINRGVNSFFTESYVIEWTCCVRQRVEIRIKWNEWMDCFSGGWKVRRQTKIVQGAIEQKHNFRNQIHRIMLKICFENSLHYNWTHIDILATSETSHYTKTSWLVLANL